MNLGQAVAVCLYELIRNPTSPKPETTETRQPAEDLDRLTALLTEVLESPAMCTPKEATPRSAA